MKVKPKEILVNLPTVLMFSDYNEIPQFASTINQIVHGKIKIKYEELGLLGGQYIGLFYIKRDEDSQRLRDEFMFAILQEEQERYGK
jgi:hypothetical protein